MVMTVLRAFVRRRPHYDRGHKSARTESARGNGVVGTLPFQSIDSAYIILQEGDKLKTQKGESCSVLWGGK